MYRGRTGRPGRGRPGHQPFALTALALAVSMQCAQAQDSGTAQAGSTAVVQLPTVSVRADGVENYGPANKKSVSATKSDVPIADTPQSISVITADQMRAQGAQRVEEALRYSAGVRTEPIVDTRRSTYMIRGFTVSQNSQYWDGLKLPASGGYGGWELEPYSLDRVDVVRGPSSVLYGQTSPGGLINQISKRPQAETANEINLSFGNYDRKEVSGDFTGALDKDGKVLYRLTALARDSGTQTNMAGDDRFFIAPQITWRPTDATSFTAYAQIYHDNAGNSANFLPALGTITPLANGSRIPTDLFTGEPGFDRFKREQYLAGYEFSHRLNDTVTLRQNLRYGHMYVSYENIGGNGGLVANPPNGPYLLRRIGLRSNESFDLFTVDNQAQIKVRHGIFDHTILTGIDYSRSTFDRLRGLTGNTPAAQPPLNIFNPVYGNFVAPNYQTDEDTTRSQIGFYLQDMVRISDRFMLQLAGRYDKAKVSTDTRALSTNAVTRTGSDDGKFTGRAGLLWEGPYGLSPYVSYSTSFEPATAVPLFGGGTPQPTTGKQYEAGLKWQPAGSRSFAQLSLFDLTQANVLTTSPVSGFSSQLGEVRSRGVELEGTWSVTPNFNILASYTYTDAEVTKAGPNAPNAGKTPQYVPRHMASLWADYRLSSGFLAGVWLGGGVRYVSKTYDQTNVTEVPGFTLVDLAASYSFARHYTLRLNVNNLFDKTYVAACDSATNCYYGRRRTIIGTVTYRW
ncbi:Iron complex outermembrane recepter protein (plasmid) [Cupriavidus taiwanensis]|uniref:Iron complex outermembrane recepter protein n=2 Tax=Burkholderiaceae TaxID=119060 RepID=A0A9Q7XUR8_9BURK|nr:Iron complex outermembrane recepter protein [Cupriavidus taiwanensis]